MAEEGCEAAGSGDEKGFSAMVRGVLGDNRRWGNWVVLVGLGEVICAKCWFCAKPSTLHLQRFEERKNRNWRRNKASGSHMPLHLALVEEEVVVGFRLLIFSEGEVLISGFDLAPNHQKQSPGSTHTYSLFRRRAFWTR